MKFPAAFAGIKSDGCQSSGRMLDVHDRVSFRSGVDADGWTEPGRNDIAAVEGRLKNLFQV